MRRTALFCATLRETPAEADQPGHALLLRAGFIQSLATGIYSLLPLGERVRKKIEAIMRQEMDAVGGQEVSLPVTHPAELWQETGRWHDIGPELIRFRDRSDRDMVLAMTHEEVVADLVRKQIRSYRQLPFMLYQIQTKFRDEPRARGGLIRAREFLMKDAYSCHASIEDLDRYYPEVYQAYFNIFRRSGIDVIAVEGDVGMMGGSEAHEFEFLSEIGEDRVLLCSQCGYAANRETATFDKGSSPDEAPLAVEEVATPDTPTIAALARLLDVPESRTAKAAFFMSGDRLIFAVIRGDMEVNEVKLANAIRAPDLRPAGPEDLAEAGIVAGYASPIGVEDVTVVVDDLVARSPNLVAGANRPGYHLRNTNFGRDFEADLVVDIAAADEGMPCPRCGAPLAMARGIEVGNIFKLGTKYTHALGATFLDEDGVPRDVVMASYGIGVGRLMGTLAEACRDDRGLIWPVTVAPFEVYLVGLDLGEEPVRAAAEDLYEELLEAGVDVLYDDRSDRAGVKFNDADLLGIPIRITVSRRTIADGESELKPRASGEVRRVPLKDTVQEVRHEIQSMHQAIEERLRPEAQG